MVFDKDKNGLWWIGNKGIVPATSNISINDDYVDIRSIGDGDPHFEGLVTELTNIKGVPYKNVDDLLNNVNGFFMPVGWGSTSGVASVNGMVGNVVINAEDVSLEKVENITTNELKDKIGIPSPYV